MYLAKTKQRKTNSQDKITSFVQLEVEVKVISGFMCTYLADHVHKNRYKEASGLEVVAQSISPQKDRMCTHTCMLSNGWATNSCFYVHSFIGKVKT